MLLNGDIDRIILETLMNVYPDRSEGELRFIVGIQASGYFDPVVKEVIKVSTDGDPEIRMHNKSAHARFILSNEV